MSTKFNPDMDYVIDGEAMNRLWTIANRFNDAMSITASERWDYAKTMQRILDGRSVEMPRR